MRVIKATPWLLAIILAYGVAPTPVSAQSSYSQVVPTCGTLQSAYVAGTSRPETQGVDGKKCVNATVTANLSPVTVTTTDKAGTITSGGVAQTAIALNASRKQWCIQNSPTATEALNVRVNGTASATTGTSLAPGQQTCSPSGIIDTAAVSVFAATTSHAFLGQEFQ